MSDRYYISTPPADGKATLDGSEAHHLLHVMRARVGDQVTLFDGSGGEYAGTVESCGRREVVVNVGERQEISREPAVRLTLGVALPKGERQKWLVEKLTELGVAELVTLSTERSVADLKGKSLEKLERAVIESSKQCGRNQLMQIGPPQSFADFVTSTAGVRLLAHPTGKPVAQVLPAKLESIAVIIGPEGGLSETEVALAVEYGWQSVSLGASILRIETAAVALAALVAFSGEA